MSAFTEAVERNLKGVHFISVGACPGCAECGLADRVCSECSGTSTVFVPSSNLLQGDEIEVACHACAGAGKFKATELECETAGEGHFSWLPCDGCGSGLGGQRFPLHGVVADTMDEAREADKEITHFDVCVDCLMYHANGEEPETWQQSSRETEREQQ